METLTPKRHGFPWTEKDIRQLIRHVRNGHNPEDIARFMGRTVRAICIAIDRFYTGVPDQNLFRRPGDVIINRRNYSAIFDSLRYNLYARVEIHAATGY